MEALEEEFKAREIPLPVPDGFEKRRKALKEAVGDKTSAV